MRAALAQRAQQPSNKPDPQAVVLGLRASVASSRLRFVSSGSEPGGFHASKVPAPPGWEKDLERGAGASLSRPRVALVILKGVLRLVVVPSADLEAASRAFGHFLSQVAVMHV